MCLRISRPVDRLVMVMGVSLLTGVFAGTRADGAVYKFTNPGGTDLVDADTITAGAAVQTNYASKSDALAAFKHGQNAIVWTVDETLTGQTLGNLAHTWTMSTASPICWMGRTHRCSRAIRPICRSASPTATMQTNAHVLQPAPAALAVMRW